MLCSPEVEEAPTTLRLRGVVCSDCARLAPSERQAPREEPPEVAVSGLRGVVGFDRSYQVVSMHGLSTLPVKPGPRCISVTLHGTFEDVVEHRTLGERVRQKQRANIIIHWFHRIPRRVSESRCTPQGDALWCRLLLGQRRDTGRL